MATPNSPSTGIIGISTEDPVYYLQVDNCLMDSSELSSRRLDSAELEIHSAPLQFITSSSSSFSVDDFLICNSHTAHTVAGVSNSSPALTCVTTTGLNRPISATIPPSSIGMLQGMCGGAYQAVLVPPLSAGVLQDSQNLAFTSTLLQPPHQPSLSSHQVATSAPSSSIQQGLAGMAGQHPNYMDKDALLLSTLKEIGSYIKSSF